MLDVPLIVAYNNKMEDIKTSYVTQYCNIILEWERNNLDIDTASQSQVEQLQQLKAKALEQSGLTLNELTLIMLCRKYRIFKRVNTYVRKQIKSL